MVCRLAFVIVSVGTIAAVIYLGRNGTVKIEYRVYGFVHTDEKTLNQSRVPF